MAKYYLFVKVFSRGKGSRVTKAAAYRAGERIRDERTSGVYDHTDRQDVVHKEIVLPSLFAGRTDTNWARDRSTLWNAAEHAGKRRDARLAREVLVLLPTELTPAQRTGLALTFSRQLADRYQNAVDLAVHEPRPGSDERSHHAHLLMTVREVTPAGLGRRTTLELGGAERYARGLGPWKSELLWIRERWAQVTNEALRDAGLAARVDHRSYKDQGIDREPVPTMPRSVYYVERRTGVAHPLGEDIRARHRERLEARLQGPGALAQVLRRQREESRRGVLRDSQQKAALPKKVRRAMLTRDELNREKREWHRAHAAEINRKKREWRKAHAGEINLRRREQRRANASEVNRKRAEWRKAHRAEVNRKQREYRKAHAAELNRREREKRRAARAAKDGEARNVPPAAARTLAAERNLPSSDLAARNRLALLGSESRSSALAESARSGPLLPESHEEPSPTAAESARRWLELREHRQESPTPEESARQWSRFRESGERSPTAEESARRWAELRERERQAGPLEDTSDKGPQEHSPPRKVAEDDDEEAKRGKSDRSRDDSQGL